MCVCMMYVWVKVRTGDHMPCLMGTAELTSSQFETTAATPYNFSNYLDIRIIFNMKTCRQSCKHMCTHTHTRSTEGQM